jgi:cystathionine beta-lyase/cystathionine gamma-synthase
MGFSTDAIHAGQESDPTTGAVVPPLYLTTTYEQEAPGKHKGFDYSRTINPTRLALEKNLAVLEKGEWGLCFASGMAAISTVIQSFRSGDRLVVSANCYGGTYRVLKRVFERFGIESVFVDTSVPELVAAAIDGNTRLVLVETPTNPNLGLTDIEAVAKVTRERGVLLMVDNTFATPYLQQPIELGADLVVHSMTKYLGGHSDSVGGALVGRDPDLRKNLAFIQNAYGAILSPFDSWLILRGIKTLAVRMERHCHNAIHVARFLAQSPKVHKVYYPGLPSHPQRDLAERQMRAFGGIVSFDLGSLEAAKRFAGALSIGMLAESLGAVETLINHPAIMTHASIPEADRIKSGITDGLLRISVGIEDVEDLQADFEAALKAV